MLNLSFVWLSLLTALYVNLLTALLIQQCQILAHGYTFAPILPSFRSCADALLIIPQEYGRLLGYTHNYHHMKKLYVNICFFFFFKSLILRLHSILILLPFVYFCVVYRLDVNWNIFRVYYREMLALFSTFSSECKYAVCRCSYNFRAWPLTDYSCF